MLKPLRIEIDCVFVCPSCETETWYTIRQLKRRKYLKCVCGQKTRLEPVHDVTLTYAGRATEQLDQSGHRTGPAVNTREFVAVLVQLGHKRALAQLLVEQCKDKYTNDSQFLSLLLQQGAKS